MRQIQRERALHCINDDVSQLPQQAAWCMTHKWGKSALVCSPYVSQESKLDLFCSRPSIAAMKSKCSHFLRSGSSTLMQYHRCSTFLNMVHTVCGTKCKWSCKEENFTNYKLQITNYKSQITNWKLQITNWKLQNTKYKMQNTKYKIQITNWKLQIEN